MVQSINQSTLREEEEEETGVLDRRQKDQETREINSAGDVNARPASPVWGGSFLLYGEWTGQW